MKVPTPRRLPSGAWNVRIQVDGKSHSITRPTEKECLAEAMAVKAGQKQARTPDRRTLTAAIDSYIESRQNVLSPATIRGYRTIQSNRFQSAMHRRIQDISPQEWQRIVNLESRLCGAKTLKNAWGFLSSVIRESTGEAVTVRLPQVVAEVRPFLAPEDIPSFLDAIRGTPCEVAILLGLSGLRRSELLAIRWADIDCKAGCIRVHGSAVPEEGGKLVYRKENKNAASRRTVPFLLPRLRELAADQPDPKALAVTCHYSSIWRAVKAACQKAGVPEIDVHGLRRSFASLAYHLGLSEEVTMRAGGWSDIYTMRKIYTQVSEADYIAQAQLLSDFFDPTKPKNPKSKKKPSKTATTSKTVTKTGTKSKTA